jgi:AmmeMemoRadiSam system protein B/AmmeMemoRadiSam system protein A
MKEEMQAREPAVAGSFYPDAREELKDKLNGLFGRTEKRVHGRLKILIEPHAGIDYSGLTAAWGYKQTAGVNYRTVMLLGVSHRVWFEEAVVDGSEGWKTPLGLVKVDRLVRERLATRLGVKVDCGVHEGEHSLEMQVIWLQRVLKNFKIVPILVNQLNNEIKKGLVDGIAGELKKDKTLMVISSDLSHYPPDEVAKRADEVIIKSVVSGKVEVFDRAVERVESGEYQGVVTAACGAEAIGVGLEVAEKVGVSKWELFDYRNSGDVRSDKSSVVGYAAIGGMLGKDKKAKLEGKSYQKEALEIARRTLSTYLGGEEIPEVKIKSKELKKKQGVFVTIKSKGELRGCIGELEARKPAGELIREMVVEAAIRDPRFYPVTAKELPGLEIEISLLSPLKSMRSWRKIKLGKEGVVIEKEGKRGVFLPQVAEETGWGLEEFMRQLCLKAGLPEDAYKSKGVKLRRFEVEKIQEN